MKINNNTVVSVTYHLQASSTNKPKHDIETADEKNPFTFLFGAGMMIPGFENNLNGLSKGSNFSFTINPEDGYGNTETEAVVNLPIEIFKVDGVIDLKMLKVGNVLPMSDSNGHRLQGTVVSFDDNEVIMDFNHPLAGMDLHFTGTVLEVRNATDEEIAHGHVHDGTEHH